MSHTLFKLLHTLDENQLWYRLDRLNADSVLVSVASGGERLEIDVFEDGRIEFSRFTGNEEVETSEEALDRLLERFGAEADEAD